tara:strand:- start:5548 stop:6384 length:837 start_codon:yes stop_codon:yes gene_type:complete
VLLEENQADFIDTLKQARNNEIDFEVNLEVFNGPLNLLLFVIEKNEVNVLDISIINIIKDYLLFLDSQNSVDVNELSNFLLLASRIMLIKSRNLLPDEFLNQLDSDEDFNNDESLDHLSSALNEIKNYQDIIKELKELEYTGQSHIRENVFEKVSNFEDSLDGVSLEALSVLFNQAVERIKLNQHSNNTAMGLNEKISFTDRIGALTKTLNTNQSIDFFDYISQASSLEQIIVDFLCILTLIKVGYVNVLQDNKFGPILINKLDGVNENILSSIVNEF